MSRYIDIEPYEKDGWYLQKRYRNFYGEGIKTVPLVSVPTADAEPVKQGHWIEHHFTPATVYYKCSECGYSRTIEAPYCEKCGARMCGVE